MIINVSEHSLPYNYEGLNYQYLARSEELWDSLDNSGWWRYEEPIQPEEEPKKAEKRKKDI